MSESGAVRTSVSLLEMRAQATAAGFVQLCRELRNSGQLDDTALDRIKDVIADELAEHAPRSTTRTEFLTRVHERLDRIFAAGEAIGPLPSELQAPSGRPSN